MTERNELMLAALASAAMPSIAVAGVFPGATRANGVDQAQVRDVTGKTYDVYASDDEQGRARLARRVKAAKALADAREPGGLGFALDRVVAFVPGTDRHGPTGETAVMVAMHQDGRERPLDLLTLDDCASMGTAIGAIHRLNPAFIAKAGYPVHVTSQIRAQLTAWIARLKNAGHVPPEITSSWAKIMGTEGLWSFTTCLVHGGFEDGDVRFNGSTITAVNNWQNMQVNDPARDLAWVFAKLDEPHRNAVLTAYGRMMGNRLDDLIMLRANLWVQMEQVGDFIQALCRGDSAGIIQFKAQVDRLAHQLGITVEAAEVRPAAKPAGARGRSGAGAADGIGTGANPPSTITVGTLLKDGERRRAAESRAPQAGASDRTGPAHVVAAGSVAVAETDDTNNTPIHADGVIQETGTGSTTPQPVPPSYPSMPAPNSSVTIAFRGTSADADPAPEPKAGDAAPAGSDDTDERDIAHEGAREPDPDTSATIVIPLLEREERALRDARASLEFDDETFDEIEVPSSDDLPDASDASDAAPQTGETRDGDAADDTETDDTGEAHVTTAGTVSYATSGTTTSGTTTPDTTTPDTTTPVTTTPDTTTPVTTTPDTTTPVTTTPDTTTPVTTTPDTTTPNA